MGTVIINLPPRPKGRPRFDRNGHAYTPEATREYEDVVRLIARRALNCPLRGAIRLTIDFYLPIPKSWSKAKKADAAAGIIRPTTKPDIDNLTKAVLDALNNGIGYHDDSQVVELLSREFYGEPRTIIRLEEITK